MTKSNFKNFLHGIRQAYDFFGISGASYKKIYGHYSSPEEADFYALRSDWQAVGDDIRLAMEKVRCEQKQQQIAL